MTDGPPLFTPAPPGTPRPVVPPNVVRPVQPDGVTDTAALKAAASADAPEKPGGVWDLRTAAGNLEVALQKSKITGVKLTPEDADTILREKTGGKYGINEVGRYLLAGKPNLTNAPATAVDKFLNTAMLGTLPQYEGAVTAAFKRQPGESRADAYYRGRDQQREALGVEQQERPILSGVSDVAGAIASPINKVLPKGVGLPGLVKQGAIVGGAYGFGSTNVPRGTPWAEYGKQAAENTGIGAVGGGIVGGLTGGALHLAGAVPGAAEGADAALRGLSRATGGRTGPSAAGTAGGLVTADNAGKLNQILETAGVTPTEAHAQLRGPRAMLADVNPIAARATIAASPAAGKVIRQGLTDRTAEQLPAIQKAMETAYGVPRGDLSADTQHLIATNAAEAKVNYDLTYASPDLTSRAVLDPVERLPSLRKAYPEVQRMAAEDGVYLPDLPPAPKGPPAVPGAAHAASEAERDARFRAENPGVSDELLARIKREQPDRYFSDSDTPKEDEDAHLQALPVRAVDYLKRAVETSISPKALRMNPKDGADVASIRRNLNEWLQAVDAESPTYARTRAEFAPRARLVEAANMGHDAVDSNLPPEEIAKELASLGTPAERAIYKRALIDRRMNKLEDARGSDGGASDLINRFYDSQGGQARVRAGMTSQATFDAFDREMRQMMREAVTKRAALGNSQTDVNVAAGRLYNSGTPLTKLLGQAWKLKTNPAAFIAAQGDQVLASGAAQQARAVAPALVAKGPKAHEVLRALVERNERGATARRAIARWSALVAAEEAKRRGLLAGGGTL